MAAPLIGIESSGRDPGALTPLIVDLVDTVDLGHLGVDRFDPRTPFRMLLYSYVTGVYGSHDVESHLRDRGAYALLLGSARVIPADLAEFRHRYHDGLVTAVTEALEIARIAGVTKLGLVDLRPGMAETARAILDKAAEADLAWRHTQGETLDPELRSRVSRQTALRDAARMLRGLGVRPAPTSDRPGEIEPFPPARPGVPATAEELAPPAPSAPRAHPWDWALTGVMWFALVSAVMLVWLPGYAGAIWTGAAVTLLGGVWTARQLVEGRPVVHSWLLLPLAVIPLTGVAQLVTGVSIFPRRTQEASLQAFYMLGGFFLFLQVLASPTFPGARAFLRSAVTIFSLFLGSFSAVQYLSSGGKLFWTLPGATSGGPLLGPFINRDHFAVLAELLLPIVLYDMRMRTARRQFASLPALAAGSLFGAVVLGASRAGGILASVTMLLVSAAVLLFDSTAPRRRARYAALIAALVVASASTVGWEPLLQRFTDPDQWKGRREMNAASWIMVQERPLTGFGLGTWTAAYPSHAVASLGVFANAAHNDWAQYAVEGGVVAFACLLAIFLWSVMATFRHWWALGLVLVFVHASVDFPLQIPALGLWFAAVMAAAAAEDHVQTAKEHPATAAPDEPAADTAAAPAS